ncbi:urease accessory protein UreF [Rhizobium sp. LjRoot30]|uniref:urease accessory protein UreF n=1 Tax=Rhizobium sp. LjRoot30 TaxID=3342320 RepID=UPI003ECDC96D
MDDGRDMQAMLRLLTWLSPAFPVGAFAYSGGLERAVHDEWVTDGEGLRQWIVLLLTRGSAWNDAVLFAESHRQVGDAEGLAAVVELASALSGSRERHMETMLLGQAFLAAAQAWPHPVLERLGPSAAYPVAVGAVAGAHAVAVDEALAAFLHAVASQLVSAAIRLGVCGQRDGVAVLAALEAVIADTAKRAALSSLDDLGSATIGADIASLRHEVQTTRLFRS